MINPLTTAQQGDYDALDTLTAFDGTDMQQEYRQEVVRANGGPDYRAELPAISRKRQRSFAISQPSPSSCGSDIRTARGGAPRISRAFAGYAEVPLPRSDEVEPCRPLGFLERLSYFSRAIF